MLDIALIAAAAVFLLVGVLSYLAGRSQGKFWQACVDRVTCMLQGRQNTDGGSWDR